MSLFNRKPALDDVEHCPQCGERVPEGAVSCAMCGQALQTPPDERSYMPSGRLSRSTSARDGPP